jgi:hypothetical protein
MKNPRFDYSTDLGNASSLSEDDEKMLMVKYLDYKLLAQKASTIMVDALKIKNKKARKVLVEKSLVDGSSVSSKHCQIVETYSRTLFHLASLSIFLARAISLCSMVTLLSVHSKFSWQDQYLLSVWLPNRPRLPLAMP